MLEFRVSSLQPLKRHVEFVVDPRERSRDLLRRGVFDPQLIPFLEEAYRQNIRDPKWFEQRFGSYLELIRTAQPTVIEDERKSYADYCNFEAELARVHRAKQNKLERPNDSYETLAHVLHLADTNLQTLINELLLGATTRYGYKFVLNPLTNESKVVFYDSLVNGEETWEEAWSREDVRISFLRSVEQTKEHLRYREWINVYVFNQLCSQWETHMYSTPKQQLYFWISPPPAKPGDGYGTTRMSFVYAPYKSGAYEVTIGARTIISEYSNAHLRRLAQDLVSPEADAYRHIHSLSLIPSDADLLSICFRIREDYVDYDLSEFTTHVEDLLDSYKYLHWTFPLYAKRQKTHVASRIADEDTRDFVHLRSSLKRDRIVNALAEEKPVGVLRRLVIEFEEECKQIYAEVRQETWESELKQKGIEVTDAMRDQNAQVVEQDIKKRQENSNCNSQLRKTRLVKRINENGEEEWVEEEESDQNCMIRCKNEWLDKITKMVIKCIWKTEASKDTSKQFSECPCCGWNPDKPTTLELQKQERVLQTNESENEEFGFVPYTKKMEHYWVMKDEEERKQKQKEQELEELLPIPIDEFFEYDNKILLLNHSQRRVMEYVSVQ